MHAKMTVRLRRNRRSSFGIGFGKDDRFSPNCLRSIGAPL